MKYFLRAIFLLGSIAAVILAVIAFVKANWELGAAWAVAGCALLSDFGFADD